MRGLHSFEQQSGTVQLWCGAVRHAAHLRTCILGADATQMAAALFVASQTPRLSLSTTVGVWPAQVTFTSWNFEKTP
jgi:hypothetical protein